jgi:hypothetical protein
LLEQQGDDGFELLHGSRVDLERHRRMGARTAAGAAVVVEARVSVLGATQCWWLVFRWKGRRPSVRGSRNRAPVPGDAVLSGALPRPRWVGHGMSDMRSYACAEVRRARGKWKYFLLLTN